MYVPNTILALKEPKPPVKVPKREDPDTGRVRKAHEIPFAWNEVRVVGQSPIAHTAGDPGVILEPLTYHGSTLDEPLSKVQRLYDIKEEPVEEVVIEPIRVIRAGTRDAGPSPEEIFEKEGGGVPPEPGQTRGRTSPLGDDLPPKGPDSPLGS
jgi:hypothetical protein